MINDLIGRNGVKASARTPSQWQVGLDDATRAALAAAARPGPRGATGATGPVGPPGAAATPGTILVNFGAFPGGTEATATVAVTNLQPINAVLVWPALVATANHTADEVYLEEFRCEVTAIAAGSFNLLVRPRVGLSFNTYRFNYLYL